MKLWIEIDYEIDGEATQAQILNAANALIKSGVVTSEEVDDGEAYALLVTSFEVFLEKPTAETFSPPTS